MKDFPRLVLGHLTGPLGMRNHSMEMRLKGKMGEDGYRDCGD